MRREYRRFFVVLLALLALTTGVVRAQEMDEDGLIIAEDMLIDEAIEGDLPEEEPAVALEEEVPVEGPALLEEAIEEILKEPAAEVVEEAVEAPVAEEPEIEEAPLEEIKGVTVEELVEEALGVGEPVVEAVEEPALEAVEEIVEEPALEIVEEIPEEPALEIVEEEIPEEPVLEVVEEEMPEEPVLEIVEEIPEEPAVAEEELEEEGLDWMVEKEIAEAIAEGVSERPVLPEVEAVELRAVEHAEVMGQQEELRRRALEAHGRESLKQAEKAFKRRNYQNAIKLFEEAHRHIGKRHETELERRLVRQGLGKSFYARALVLRKQRDLDSAQKMARSAEGYGHPGASKLVARIREEKERPPKPPVPRVVKRWDKEEFKVIEKSTADMLRLGREYFLTGEYDRAQEMFENVLKRDPHNREAIRLMQKVTQKKYDIATMELDATRQDMVTELRRTWNPRDYGLGEEYEQILQEMREKKKPEEESTRIRVLNKMKQIKIPDIDFREANIHDVIDFLQEASVEFDPSDDPEEQGVNIILNLRAGLGPAVEAGAEEDIFAAPAGIGEAVGEEVPLITFSARYISLLEALRIVTQVSNLKYRIEGNVVMIIPIDAPEGEIIHRMYDVLPTVVERIAEIGPGLSVPSRGDFIAMEEPGMGERADWKEFFAGMGVKWPDGSSIKHIPAIGKIVVANTADNLTVFEQILAVLNVVPNQIEIEARFVEIRQTDLDALGFEWLLADEWAILQKKGQRHLPLSARERISMSANAASGGFTAGNRFLSDGVEGVLPGVSEDVTLPTIQDTILNVAGILTNPELTFILHMLQQKGNVDLLSAPKITTQSGQEATIKVVTEYIYPTEFTVTPIMGTSVGGVAMQVGGVVEPSNFETREVGVLLTVLPEVSPEGHMINLTLSPEVVDEPIWKDYGSVFEDVEGNRQILPMPQPFFYTRSINTSVSVYNGATVVMGGMIRETRNEVSDKIPFLGDIPLIGRLFQSRYEKSDKRNLLIFVTARLVDPAGRMVGRATGTSAMAKEMFSKATP